MVAYDNAVGHNPGSNEASATISFTVGGGSNRLILLIAGLVSAPANNPVLSTVAYGAASLGFVSGSRFQSVGDNFMNIEAWFLVAPATGTANLVITPNVSMRIDCGILSFTGVDQSTPIGTPGSAEGSSTSPSKTISSATDELVVDGLLISGGGNAETVGGGQTERVNTDASEGFVTSEEAGAASVVMSWTLNPSTIWLQLAMAIKAAATGGPPTGSPNGFDSDLEAFFQRDVNIPRLDAWF